MKSPDPYYVDSTGSIVLYNGDALELLERFEGAGVDAIVTDPPYGLGFADWDVPVEGWLELAREVAPLVVFTTAPTTLWDYPRPDWLGCWTRRGSTSRTAQGGFNHWSPILLYGPHRLQVDTIDLPEVANPKARGTKNGHPCPKPLALATWLLRSLSISSVLDPFAGSGTTLRAAKDLGGRAIGIELDESYCKIAAARLQQEVLPFQ